MSELDNIGELLNNNKLKFNYYSIAGVNAMWDFPFCDDDNICEEHTTFFPKPSFLWPLRRIHMNYDLELTLRCYHSAIVFFMRDPYHDYPRIIARIGFLNNIIDVAYKLSEASYSHTLGQVTIKDIVDYWKWTQLHFIMNAHEMQIMRNEDGHFETLLKVNHDIMNSLRWFSIGANYSITHWTLYCEPLDVPSAYPPECAFTKKEYGYSGTQWVINTGNQTR